MTPIQILDLTQFFFFFDRETNLKSRQCDEATNMLGEDETALSQFNARIICEPPNSNLSSFKGMYFPVLLYLKIRSLSIFPSIAQLVERRTVVEIAEILRSLVRIRFEGLFEILLNFFLLFRNYGMGWKEIFN